jgi:hypothetical protein
VLGRCLDSAPSTDVLTGPPDKIQLSLGFARLSITRTAFSYTYALSSFVRAVEDAESMEKELFLDHFDADHVYD